MRCCLRHAWRIHIYLLAAPGLYTASTGGGRALAGARAWRTGIVVPPAKRNQTRHLTYPPTTPPSLVPPPNLPTHLQHGTGSRWSGCRGRAGRGRVGGGRSSAARPAVGGAVGGGCPLPFCCRLRPSPTVPANGRMAMGGASRAAPLPASDTSFRRGLGLVGGRTCGVGLAGG